MRKGYLVYEKEDAVKNKAYIDWLIEEASKKELEVKLIINNKEIFNLDKDEEKLYDIDFVINRSRDYKLTEFFESKGIRVFNKSKFCLLGNDKVGKGFLYGCTHY